MIFTSTAIPNIILFCLGMWPNGAGRLPAAFGNVALPAAGSWANLRGTKHSVSMSHTWRGFKGLDEPSWQHFSVILALNKMVKIQAVSNKPKQGCQTPQHLQYTSGRPELPHQCISYPSRMAHRVTPGKTEVTPGRHSYWHTDLEPSFL